MERFVQTLDDLEDLAYALALKWERIQRVFRFAIFMATAMLLQTLAVILAIYYPPLAFAICALMLVGLLYRSATSVSSGILPSV